MVLEDSLDLFELVKIDIPLIEIKSFIIKNIHKYKALIDDLNNDIIKNKVCTNKLVFKFISFIF
jgi:hypothetical protein